MFKLTITLLLSFFSYSTTQEELKQTYTSNQGLNLLSNVYPETFNILNDQFINTVTIDTLFVSNLNLDVSTKINFNNYQINGDLNIDNVKLITNFKASFLSPSSFKNFSVITLTDTNILGSMSIRNSEVSNQLNDNIVNLENNLLVSVYLKNVVIDGDLVIGSNNLFSHTILIENCLIKGTVRIDGNKIFTGTVIIRDTTVNGFIRIERVDVAKRIDLDTNVITSNPITICPNPFYTSYKGKNYNGCYYYASGNANNYEQAASRCKSIGGSLITIYNRKIVEDLPKIFDTFSEYYYWIGATKVDGFFKWQDGTNVNNSFWCSSYPSGSSGCTYYTTQPLIGNDKCIKNGPCSGNWFDHAVVCQYLHIGANYHYY